MKPASHNRTTQGGLASLEGGGTIRVRRMERLPELAPVGDEPAVQIDGTRVPAAKPTLEHVFRFTHDSIHDESTDFRERSEARDPFAFLTVYAINAAVMLFAFPVGFALLVFNILGGENLRTTLHVMGLTGLACALPFLGFDVPFLT
jgi:hypothetical protein